MKRKVVAGLFLLAVFSAGAEAQWVQSLPMKSPVLSLANCGTTLIAGTNGQDSVGFIDTSPAAYAPTIYLTTTNGTSWIAPDTAVKWGGAARCFAVDGSTVYLGLSNGITNNPSLMIWTVIYTSSASTNFTRWDPVPAPTPDFYFHVFSMAFFGSNLYVGGEGGVYRSANSGASWTFGGFIPEVAALLALSDTNLFAGTGGVGMFRSNNNATSWTAIDSGLAAGPYDRWINCLASSGTSLFAGTQAGVYRSSNNGTSWTEVNTGLTDTNVTALAISGSTIFAGTSISGRFGGGIFRSTDNGATWTAVNEGFPTFTYPGWGTVTDIDIRSLVIHGDTLFAGAYSGGVWQRPLSDMATSVERGAVESPVQCRLEQNYPNPFNPSTTIKYELPRTSHVSLTVYDILGRQVAVLVNEWRDAGIHEVKFDGSNLASGIYFCRIQAGSFVQSRKLLLLR